jgi:GABA(A) receptor-associated protein
MLKFRDRPANERKNTVHMIFKKYPDRIPVHVSKENNNVPTIDKDRFLVPSDLTVGQFLYVIRHRIKLKPEQALYIYFNNQLVNTSTTIKEVYNQHKNIEDDMLYCVYSTENTFG